MTMMRTGYEQFRWFIYSPKHFWHKFNSDIKHASRCVRLEVVLSNPFLSQVVLP